MKESIKKGWCTFQTQESCGVCKSGLSYQQQSNGDGEMGQNQNLNNKFDFLKDSFILDTGSIMLVTIMNEDLITNIRKADIPIVMTTNAVTKTLNIEANIPNFGKAMLDNTQITNLLGFSHLAEQSGLLMIMRKRTLL